MERDLEVLLSEKPIEINIRSHFHNRRPYRDPYLPKALTGSELPSTKRPTRVPGSVAPISSAQFDTTIVGEPVLWEWE
jgi:hypothetical protein